MWTCLVCGNEIEDYESKCLCGYERKHAPESPTPKWTCLVCGNELDASERQCVCGYDKDAEQKKDAKEKFMFCPYCGNAVIAQNASFCTKCGKALASTQGINSPGSEDGSLSISDRMHLCKLVLFSSLSLGIYLPVWYLKRKDTFNKLRSTEKIGMALPVTIIVFFGMAIFLYFMSGYLMNNDQSASQGFSALGSIVNLIGSIMLIVMSFKGRRILIDHFNGHLQRQIPFSAIWTFLFGALYLQYKINRL